jgi:hypothetical protein
MWGLGQRPNKSTDEYSAPAMEISCLPGFRRRFMPQNKCCGYENSAFQAKNTLEYRNIHRSGSLQFTSSLLPERQ